MGRVITFQMVTTCMQNCNRAQREYFGSRKEDIKYKEKQCSF